MISNNLNSIIWKESRVVALLTKNLKSKKKKKIKYDIKKTKYISSFFKSDLLQSKNKTSETIINPISTKDTCFEISTNIIGMSAKKTEPLNAEIFTTDSQICENISLVLIEENLNCSNHASNFI